MASSNTAPSSSSATASATSSSSSSPSLNSNLYLFTFIATLLILLFVSSGVIIRALFLRAMHRRRVDRALAQGLVLFPEQGSNKLSFGVQPKLFDVWLTDQKKPQPVWSDITPISLQPVSSMETKHSLWASTISSRSQSTIRSTAPSEFATDLLQVSVVIAMPAPSQPPDSDQLPEVALGFTHSFAS
ncbi:hypothetical protein C8F01DRAFT_1114210 [Mycena amicta]|nr:hypothetical protein C8F01DRAFT_1114210 [Mycena amicta]